MHPSGGIESPWTFNIVVKTVLAKNKERLDECGIHMPLLGMVIVLEWAENLRFMTRTLATAHKALDIFTQGLHDMGMRWTASSMQYLHEGIDCTTSAGTKRKAETGLKETAQPHQDGDRHGGAQDLGLTHHHRQQGRSSSAQGCRGVIG